MARYFDTDALTGAIETFHFDEVDESFTIERVEDVTAVIEANKHLDSITPGNWRGDMHRVASIPATVMQELAKQGILGPGGKVVDMARFRAWLNDRDNRVFRTRPGRV